MPRKAVRPWLPLQRSPVYRHCIGKVKGRAPDGFDLGNSPFEAEPDGTVKEIRPTGMYRSTSPGDVHREGGDSEQDVIVFFDMRGGDSVFYEILDDDQNVIAALSYTDFLSAYKAQQGVG